MSFKGSANHAQVAASRRDFGANPKATVVAEWLADEVGRAADLELAEIVTVPEPPRRFDEGGACCPRHDLACLPSAKKGVADLEGVKTPFSIVHIKDPHGAASAGLEM